MKKIDVLAVMDKLQEAVDALGRDGERRYHRDGMFHLELGPNHYSAMMLKDELIEARSAVAELIDSDKSLDRLLEMKAQPFPVPNFQNLVKGARLRRELALARIGGDK